MLEVNLFMWFLFIGIIIIFLIIDLGVFHRKKHVISVKEALIWTGIWFSTAMIFNIFIWYKFGWNQSITYLTCYIIEKVLSVDNLFVMLVIFASFKIEPKNQHKILVWGIVGAVILRGIFIIVGSSLVSKFNWILYLFGLFLIYGGLSTLFKKDEKIDPHDKWTIKKLKKIFPISKTKDNGKFFVKEKGKFFVTMAFITLITIEITDIIFAADSIPAIFGITTEPFIIFTSNIFAILGLRSLYFVLLHAHGSFKHLGKSVSIILVFIGLKMLLNKFIEISALVSLIIILFLLSGGIIASLVFSDKKKKKLKKSLKIKKILFIY